MSGSTPVAAIGGWFTLDSGEPHLIGARCPACGSYFFPAALHACRNPTCGRDGLESVHLSRTGRVWSYTNACYQPPEPYVSPEPFESFAVAAVELEKERLIVLGQVIRGVGIEQLRIGMRMVLVLEPLYTDAESEKLIWKWRPVSAETL